MKSKTEDLFTKIEGLLHLHYQDFDAEALQSLRKVYSLTSGSITEGASYTQHRAMELVSLADYLLDQVRSVPSLDSYSDRAKLLSSLSSSYLRMAHAFKTGNKVWASAQSDLIPFLRGVEDESSIDEAFSKLSNHILLYRESLGSWISLDHKTSL